jgi:hypothetical protein
MDNGGMYIILLPIFIFWTSDNINRQKRAIERLLIDKGANYILSVEWATRNAMVGSIMDRFPMPEAFNQLRDQNPLRVDNILYTQNPEISYIILTDLEETSQTTAIRIRSVKNMLKILIFQCWWRQAN